MDPRPAQSRLIAMPAHITRPSIRPPELFEGGFSSFRRRIPFEVEVVERHDRCRP